MGTTELGWELASVVARIILDLSRQGQALTLCQDLGPSFWICLQFRSS